MTLAAALGLRPLRSKAGAPASTAKPAAAASSADPSGTAWVARFPTSTATADLKASFRTKVEAFIAAIEAAGGTVSIGATLRPAERAFLMHYAYKVAKGQVAPDKVPRRSGVDINWVHATVAASRKAAQEMVDGYEIVYAPALSSRHTEGRAIDMTLTGIIGQTMTDAKGKDVLVNTNAVLHAVGAGYGVIKLASDPPHWSEDGH